MYNINQPRILRKPDVLALTNLSKSTMYNRIKEGLWPTPISLGSRAVGFVQFECETVLQAMIAGQSATEIKVLVKDLLTQRKLEIGGGYRGKVKTN
ncbi:helix-turn-helix transcriptional regulator [Brumicola pallidula]|uniref:AlpA-like transcriptional regulator n=1 Tax=Brumicola pallidula DSM 14239 = ACAM 615 TaxID=1121922 RepID=K6ZH72_9ALTE|nr:AlpA family phage regulatory protein [Glaciecola pallidula]GAC28263.1 alpA-like transcriptional regulator [Glaciecola pallidula DSM 14239 = ACAM 615]